jgi:hypothetical protein
MVRKPGDVIIANEARQITGGFARGFTDPGSMICPGLGQHLVQ